MHITGTMGDFTYVKRGNSYYIRRKRGTVTKASINESLQNFAKRNKLVNRTAVPVNDILKEYAGHFREGTFWQRLLSRLKKCKDDNLETHLQSLGKLELNELHAMSKHVSMAPYSIAVHKDRFTVKLKFQTHAQFRGEKNNCYYYEFIVLFWDTQAEITTHNSISTHWVYTKTPVPDYEINFKRTARDKYYLLALKLRGGQDGKTENMMRERAMMILGGGKLE